MADREERVFCHNCHHNWPNREYGLICPRCQSDFAEIIEPPSSPSARSDTQSDPDMDLDDFRIQIEESIAGPRPAERSPDPSNQHEPPGSSRDERSRSPLNTFSDHPGNEYHEYSDGAMTRRSYRSSDGRITFTATTISNGPVRRTRPPNDADSMADSFPPMLYPLDAVFRYMSEGNRDFVRGERSPRSASSEGLQDTDTDGRFVPGGLHPRDADNPQPMPPMEGINDLLGGLFRPDFPDDPEGRRGGNRNLPRANPLAIIASILSASRFGDAVYSQEELDRVISQLIDQNSNGNAPPPASQTAIQSLPKKRIDKQMLGSEGKAECSICMDAVQLDTEVTVLPCEHWFHFNCIEMWLNQHNTCPHCRRGINAPEQEDAEGTRNNPVVVPSGPEQSPSPPHFRNEHDRGSSAPRAARPSRRDNNSDGVERRRSNRNEGHGGSITSLFRRFTGS